MELPVLYFTTTDGTELRATIYISGFSFVRIHISERVGRFFPRWVVQTHSCFGDVARLREFITYPKDRVHRWAEREAKDWHEYSKTLKAYKP